ncbi:FlhC family transcriptional regulator [Halochromatium roseum]|uniref:FlhC family transcriptional regulator n=1 Tax=Halochromatium roseum TaxID=391920 RepID=UPI0019129BFB|nr:FlhC family transcriptional regulator [Halochromatium roseum]MBK5941408.1 hypothetical protein [Halochromatium roseum]
MRLQQLARTQQAVALLRCGMRTTLVQRITGLRAALVRELHREIHADKPKSGQLPSTHAVLDSVLSQASASLFIALYRALGGAETERQIQLEALLQAHRLYLEQQERVAAGGRLGPAIDINAAWVLARDLTTGLALRRFCRQCRIHYLAADFSRTALQCPICRLKQRGGWRGRGGVRPAKDDEAVDAQPPAH